MIFFISSIFCMTSAPEFKFIIGSVNLASMFRNYSIPFRYSFNLAFIKFIFPFKNYICVATMWHKTDKIGKLRENKTDIIFSRFSYSFRTSQDGSCVLPFFVYCSRPTNMLLVPNFVSCKALSSLF